LRNRYAIGGDGGGLYLFWDDNAALTGNIVQGNTAGTVGTSSGGGLYIDGCPGVTLIGNTVQNNTAGGGTHSNGGGVYLKRSPATLNGNVVRGNTASAVERGNGGGMYLAWSPTTLNGNIIVSNTAALSTDGYGGGLFYMGYGGTYTLTNNLVADNHASGSGSGLMFRGSSSSLGLTGFLLHNTIADNHGGVEGIFAYKYATLAFTNTIIAGHHSVGINVAAGCTVTVEATLWHENGAATSGAGSISTGTVNVTGDPAFADPYAWDYHLTASSAAIDEGVDVSSTLLCSRDIDGHPRPQESAPDIGADEFFLVAPVGVSISGPAEGAVGRSYVFTATVSPPTTTKPITYTWAPEPASGQGEETTVYSWTMPGAKTITVTAENIADAAPLATHEITIADYKIYLPLILRN